jgi:predicted transport protein
MKKQVIKNATNPKKEKQEVQVKNQKAKKDEKPKTQEEIVYPPWTKPENLTEEDHKALKTFYEMYSKKEFDVALDFVSNLDTIVREEIPSEIWIEIGGEPTQNEEEVLKSNDEMEEVKPEQNEEFATADKLVYPPWTTPERLTEQDHKALKEFFELFNSGDHIAAFSFASNFDLEVRGAIPLEILLEEQFIPTNLDNVETTLTQTVEEELQSKENEEVKPEPKEIRKGSINLQNLFVLKNNRLLTLTEEYFIEESLYANEVKFQTKSDLEEFIIQNHRTLFGENTVIIDNTKSTNEYFPNMLLLDFNDMEKPRMYVVEINISDSSLGLLYARITHFFAYFKNRSYQNEFLGELCNVIDTNDEVKNELEKWLNEEQGISQFLSDMLRNKPAILLIKDYENVVLDLMQAVYLDTWDKMVRQILIKRYYGNEDLILSVTPLFADIWKNEKSKRDEPIKFTENDHLCELPDRIRKIYNDIKTALLETDSNLEFNAKKHYISIRKNKNLAFLHLRRKNTDIVVMNPEADTRERIKHHRIKTLPPSVQRFWNGECCTIVVENSDNLDEVIELLKMIVGKA